MYTSINMQLFVLQTRMKVDNLMALYDFFNHLHNTWTAYQR